MRQIWIYFLLFSIALTVPVFAQKNKNETENPFGRKKKEKKNQKVFSKRAPGVFSRKKGRGNANQFANHRISGKKSFVTMIFGQRSTHNASLRKTKPSKKKEDNKLFKVAHTNAKRDRTNHLLNHNRKREKNRKRGSDVFSRKKR